jgi:hypothetical protein
MPNVPIWPLSKTKRSAGGAKRRRNRGLKKRLEKEK